MVLSRRAILTQATFAAAGGLVWTAAPAAATGRPRLEDSLRAAMRRLQQSPDGPPAVVVAIGRGGGSSLYTAGVSQLGTHRAPRAGDHMRVASVAKAFSGATALSLVSSGRLSLDTTVGRAVRGMPREWSAVTLRQLLGHTSGIPDFSGTDAFRDALLPHLLDPPPPRKLLSYATDPALAFRPGSAYAYSNSDNILVALMCESATGRRYEDVLRQRVLQPMGLGETSLPRGADLPGPVLHGYDTLGPGVPEDVTNLIAAGWSWASGGVVSTPGDLVRFIRAYVRGAVTDHRTREAQFRFRPGGSEPPGPGVNSAGLALFRYDTRYGRVYGHTGNTAGYTQFAAATPDGRAGVAVSITAQITPTTGPPLFGQLREIFELAVGVLLAG
ncbi:serine hydrolase domain-containing protein [Amycolatopsis rhabdoformis]|uniref:Serine hydrolase domain-containing protein n=1 Tax=Amycolatopsis rhabdoformis TaxID=1448059 RepID=A0ABZ1IF39_9PSEU|nr:serine hydrolase domain-containing protein [Amycolatopsis rhabdoformis]WSE33035.1 serine hydrolase domain-containing protein [Amycolatopsis rhabdoformis]